MICIEKFYEPIKYLEIAYDIMAIRVIIFFIFEMQLDIE
jgi:hypothetical protein